MWNAGKTLETIARATGRFQKDADDPLRSFRVSLTRFHKGVKVNGRLLKLPYRVSKSSVKLAVNWVRKHAEKSAQPEDLEDWTQDLLIHLRYLPPTSKYRKAGKEDTMQTFDPSKHHGANVRRFLNYINLCLGNKFRTMLSARMKNPLCRTANVSLSVQRDAENSGQVDDEYCHAHSEYLRKASEELEKQAEDRRRITEFTDFASREDSVVVPAMGAILATSTHADAARFLRTTDYGFTQMRTRLLQVGKCFENGEPCRGSGSRIRKE